ncbi:MAG TPA: acyl-CoA dehydrogenase family protein [Acidimicrobiia bacterium]|jgi:alkylation response protein AidB-like acyl-CoA dehydrogenase
MDFNYPESAEVVRAEVKAWLDANLPADWGGTGTLDGDEYLAFMLDWRSKLSEGGWLGLKWPKEYGGRGLDEIEAIAAVEECAKAGVPASGLNDAFSIGMLGNTILHIGTEEQKRHFLPRILSGEDIWCQGYSEPDAGSDLANVKTRATLDGDEWVINGQKIWTSAGHLANWIFVVCRTDPEAPKHRGITFILVPMDQPGVEVRPIKMLSGESEFNEVFFTDARAPKGYVIGEINDGWRVCMALLGFERGEDAAILPIQFKAELDRLIAYAKELGRTEDPEIRERLVKAYEKVAIMKYMGYTQLTRFANGHSPGPDAAVTKIWWSEYHQEVTELAMDILGVEGLLNVGRKPVSAFRTDDAGAPNSPASWQTVFLNARAGTIYAGTNQIQRNIIGEMMLGLPKEPRPV